MNILRFSSTLLAAGIAITSPAWSFTWLRPNNVDGWQKLPSLVNSFVTSPRETFSQYAAHRHLSSQDLRRQFGASGIISCPGGKGTAQLTGSSRIITTAAHIFCNEKNELVQPSVCTFKPMLSTKSYSIKNEGAYIGRCLGKELDAEHDVAAVYLERSVPNIEPYRLPKEPVVSEVGENITVVSGPARNFPEAYITECTVHDVDTWNAFPRLADCSIGHGSSGAGELQRTSKGWELRAVIVLENERAPENVAYNLSKSYFSASVPISGELYAAVSTMLGRNIPTHPPIAGTTQYFDPQHNSHFSAAVVFPTKPTSTTATKVTCNTLPPEGGLDENLEVSFMGMIIAPITIEACEARRQKTGSVVIAVAPMTPAETAGFNEGDIIVKWGTEAIATIEDLKKAVSHPEGSTAPVEIVGTNGNKTLTIALPGVQ